MGLGGHVSAPLFQVCPVLVVPLYLYIVGEEVPLPLVLYCVTLGLWAGVPLCSPGISALYRIQGGIGDPLTGATTICASRGTIGAENFKGPPAVTKIAPFVVDPVGGPLVWPHTFFFRGPAGVVGSAILLGGGKNTSWFVPHDPRMKQRRALFCDTPRQKSCGLQEGV